MPDHDVYAYRWISEEACYSITKNGVHFLTCTGNEEAAKRIVRILQEDDERCRSSS